MTSWSWRDDRGEHTVDCSLTRISRAVLVTLLWYLFSQAGILSGASPDKGSTRWAIVTGGMQHMVLVTLALATSNLCQLLPWVWALALRVLVCGLV